MGLSKTQLLAFNAISEFMKDLASNFGSKQPSLALYARLIEHMTLSQEIAIGKVVKSFSDYVSENQTAIEEKEDKKLTTTPISYSERLYLTLPPLFGMAENDIKIVMWKHLITIYGIFYPDSQAKDILRKMNESKGSAETELISSMVQKIVPHLNPDDTNPLQAIMGLVSSGVFTELIGTMQKGMDNGNIDMNGLMGQVQGMMAKPDLSNNVIEKKK